MTEKEMAAKRREMTELKEQRETLKKQLSEKRASNELTQELVETTENSLRSLTIEIGELETDLKNCPQPKSGEGVRSMRENTLTKETYRNSDEYRDAFFRSVANGKIAEQDVEVMTYGKRAVTEMDGESVTGGASFLVPQTTVDKINTIMEEYGALYMAVTKYKFTGNVSLPIGIVDEPTTDAEGIVKLNFHFEEVKISQEAIVATVTVKNLLLKNSISALEKFIAEQLAKFIAVQCDAGILYGDEGSFEGILPLLTPKKYTSIKWSVITSVIGALKGAYSKSGTWIMNSQTFWQEFMSMESTDGIPIIGTMPIITNNAGKWYILGLPVLMTDAVQTGDFLFGAITNNYVVNETQEMIIEADASPEFGKDKTLWRNKVYTGGAPVLAKEAFIYYVKEGDIAATPTVEPGAGAVATGTKITLACATKNTTIFYTLDGSMPTRDSMKYSATKKPVIVKACTLKAIAVGGASDSAVLTAGYTIA